MEPYIINQTGDQLQSILNKAIIKAELQTTEDGNQAIRFTASDGTSISVTLPEWSKRIEYLLQNTYYLQEGIGCAAFDYKMSLGGVTIQSEEVTRQDSDSIILDTSANRFVLERSGKFYTKFLSNGASLQGADVYASRRHTFLNRQDASYWYRKEDGTLTQGSSTFVIGNWLKTLQSECDSTQETAETARTAAQKAQTTATEAKEAAAALLQDIPWEGYHMNAFTDTGEYHIHGESTDANDGLPILNAGTIDARLTVLDSSLTRGTGEKTDVVVTQILRLSNRMGGDGHVYVRTAQAATKSQLATPSSTAWGTWEKLMGMFEKNAVTDIADLDTYTTNGMYSGLFANTTFQTLGGLEFTPGDTFLIITVNGYAASAFGTPQLTQMLYNLPSKKGSGNNSARMYLRTAYWDKDADPKAWVWANWDRLATASEISGGGGGSIHKLLVSITWSELKSLRDNSQLIAGTWYRITDYTCTTTQENTRSANHPFDVIVRADSENKLNEEAFAIQHEGDDYFASINLSAWKLWYSLDNDTTRFAWADSTNGKGVIYRMIDEWNNDIPYDFKNIQFARDWSAIAPYSGLSGTVYCYTFSVFLDGFSEDAIANEESIKAKECIESDGEGEFGNNIIRTYKSAGICFLNDIIFVTDWSSDNVYHYSNSFGSSCYSNSFGSSCYSNSFGSSCYSNSFGSGCNSNSFGSSCYSNSFGSSCEHNYFGHTCNSNSFGNYCHDIKFASDSSASTKYNYYHNNHFGDCCEYILLKGAGDASESKQLQNYNFTQGLRGTSSNFLIIDGVRNLSYETKVAKNSSGELKIYCEADLVQ